MNIKEAAKYLGEFYRDEDGFVGIGIEKRNGKDILIVYLVSSSYPVFKFLSEKNEFENFPLEVKIIGLIRALKN